MLTLQIAMGIWLGGLFLIGTIMAASVIHDRMEKNRRLGRPWWRGLLYAA